VCPTDASIKILNANLFKEIITPRCAVTQLMSVDRKCRWPDANVQSLIDVVCLRNMAM